MRRPPLLLIAPPPLLLLALLIAALPAAGQDAPAASGYTVRGIVVNALTSQPVARALVAFNDDTAMLTDSSGAFSFANIPPGEYSVSVSKPGFQSHGGFMRGMVIRVGRGSAPARPEPPLRIQVGPGMPTLTIPITPLATITGHVTLSTADPADGIRIRVYVRRLQNGHPHWEIAGQARARSDGSFRIADLEPATYMVSTMASLDRPGSATNQRLPIWGYPALYYPGVTDINAAGILTLGAGQQAEADLTLVRQQFFPVVALVHSSSDMPANFEILDTGGRNTGLSAAYDRREGVVRAAVPNGTWTMEAHAYGRTQEWGSTTFQVNSAPAAFAINLQTIPHIPVIIRREFLAAADGSQTNIAGPDMDIELTGADEMGMVAGGMTHTSDTSAASPWELNVTAPGRYWVRVHAYQSAYVSSITSGGVDLGSNPLVIVPGSTPQPVEVTLRNDGGTITGTVGSQTPGAANPNAAGQAPQIWIYAIPLFSTAESMRDVMPGSDGRFSFYNVAPGSYRVVACDTPQEIDFHSPDGLAAWTGKGQVVTVDPGGTASVDLDIVHSAPEQPE